MALESRKPLAAIELELVRAFVSAAHADLDKVKELLDKEPGLLHASMNWGGGDWETGLGAAAHVGRRDIAEYLVARGARLDIFAAAMLGHLELVKSIIEQYPDMVHAEGPHGIPLIRHAAMGGLRAQVVFQFLEQAIGGEEIK
ncbi:ankyrin repeat domain-containing protein [Cohnella sp. WQ 127256]|uniref:ankyrin repeat domain-containing protein n=1 Tax=Cohnella sp. WQ 127256 TaxID=2938790 RepID=UPI0021177ACB|nr:ankyrin repeat domain-containing protein [Cohnella sp. WQ 127256]